MPNQTGQTANRIARHPLFQILKARGTSQAWLAREMGITRGRVNQLRSGPVLACHRERIAKILGLPESVLFLPEVDSDLTNSVSSQESA